MTSRIRCTVCLRRARSRPLSFSLLRRILRGVAAVLRRSGTLRRILRRVLRRRHRGSRRPR
ncbi:ARF tumor suppressor [Gallus gallus]|nr:ARF tumor suppressor [Gallus gallus]AAN38846.1 ARF tumor suppressor [Gallus gallus]|eukprot:NP_989765.1 ARF tumor suppressor [Gallus gallus]